MVVAFADPQASQHGRVIVIDETDKVCFPDRTYMIHNC